MESHSSLNEKVKDFFLKLRHFSRVSILLTYVLCSKNRDFLFSLFFFLLLFAYLGPHLVVLRYILGTSLKNQSGGAWGWVNCWGSNPLPLCSKYPTGYNITPIQILFSLWWGPSNIYWRAKVLECVVGLLGHQYTPQHCWRGQAKQGIKLLATTFTLSNPFSITPSYVVVLLLS